MNNKVVNSDSTLHWYTHCLPDDMPRESVAGGIAIIVDVLRASTTIVTALEAGAAFVKPVVEVEEAHRLRSSSNGAWLLAPGESSPKDVDDSSASWRALWVRS